MPKIDKTTPEKIKLFTAMGIELEVRGEQAVGDCPFCGKARRFFAAVETGLWDCKVCGETGNAYSLLRKIWKDSDDMTTDYGELMQSRGLLQPDSLVAWQIVKSNLTGEWLVPAGLSDKGELINLYRYSHMGDKRRLLSAPGVGHHLFGLCDYNKNASNVYLCEGPWDGVALRDLLAVSKVDPDNRGLSITSNFSDSLLADASVLATPGCNTFDENWVKYFAGKHVTILFDNDHPREKKNKPGVFQEPASLAGVKRTTEILAKSKTPPMSIRYLRWGEHGYDPNLPAGHDLRDILHESSLQEERVAALSKLLHMQEEVPTEWLGGSLPLDRRPATDNEVQTNAVDSIEVVPCSSWKDLIDSWQIALKWTDGLDNALAVMLASIASTMQLGDQLWVKIIGPPSCGKSTLCEALSVNQQFILAKSTIRGFLSGETDDNGKDYSLIKQIPGKTLVTKDGDTLLQAPNLTQILSEGRDLYDTVTRSSYRNKAGNRDYVGVRTTWILCGTSSLRAIDSSELGERFLDCVIMNTIDDDLEDDILEKVLQKAISNSVITAEANSTKQYPPEQLYAMGLTGGYIDYLRLNAASIVSQIAFPEKARDKCKAFGKFVAYMRAKPSKTDEKGQREFAARLVSQHARLAHFLAAVTNRESVDDEVIKRTREVAVATARGVLFNIASALAPSGLQGNFSKAIASEVDEREDKVKAYLKFMKQIGITQNFHPVQQGITQAVRWRLTPKFQQLFNTVMED